MPLHTTLISEGPYNTQGRGARASDMCVGGYTDNDIHPSVRACVCAHRTMHTCIHGYLSIYLYLENP